MAEPATKKSKTSGTSTCSSSLSSALPESVVPPPRDYRIPTFIATRPDDDVPPPPDLPLAENPFWPAENPFLRALGIAPEVMFSFLDMIDANTLKLVCKLTREDVRNAFWSVDIKEMFWDRRQQVANLNKWRNAYPNALSATLSETVIFPTEDYVHLRGVRYLNLNGNKSITDAAFDHFQTFDGVKGIDTLYMSGCATITDKAFENLRGIRTLNMYGCTAITDKAFENLRGIRTLYLNGCTKVTDKAFVSLRGIDTLYMYGCTTITDKGFENLRGINTLIMNGCGDSSIATAKRVLGNIPCFRG